MYSKAALQKRGSTEPMEPPLDPPLGGAATPPAPMLGTALAFMLLSHPMRLYLVMAIGPLASAKALAGLGSRSVSGWVAESGVAITHYLVNTVIFLLQCLVAWAIGYFSQGWSCTSVYVYDV